MIDVKAIKQNNPIHSVIERMTGQAVEKHKIYAPWRQESTPSVHVYDDGSWWDFGAGIGGDVIDFVGYLFFGTGYNKDVHFAEVVDRLGGLDIRPLPAQVNRPAPPKPKLTIDLEQCIDWHTTMPTQRRAYWHSRGLSDATIDSYFLGWDGRRYTIPLLYRLVPFGVKRRQSDVADGIDAKYIMTTGSRAGIFNADVLWTADTCVICEGEIDAMLLTQLGYRAVTSTAGAGSWKEDWARFFTHVRDIYLLFDNDKAGREGAAKVHATLRRARIVTLPAGVKDVGDLWAAGYAASWLKENVG
jgi:DNA primase